MSPLPTLTNGSFNADRPTIVVCGTRKQDLEEMEGLLQSIREIYQKTIEVVLYTHFTDYRNTDIDEIFIIKNPSFSFLDKVYAMTHAPRERVLYLDCDTFLLKNIDDMFSLLDQYDIAAAHAPNRWTCFLENVPDSFPEFNCGVVLFQRSDKVNKFLTDWMEKYIDQRQQGISIPSGDQPAFRETLFLSDLRHATLTPEYNCRFNMGSMVSHTVKIVHGRTTDFDCLKERINRGPQLAYNNEPGRRYVKFHNHQPERKKGGRIKKFVRKMMNSF